MVVFTCDGKDGHSLCLDCFIQYTKVALTERQFIETAQCGYSIQCPSNSSNNNNCYYYWLSLIDKCDNSFVTEIHHFRLLGDELVNHALGPAHQLIERYLLLLFHSIV